MKMLVTAMMGVMLAGSASAVDCSQGLGAQGFRSGFESQSNVLDFLWSQYGDCYNFENFLEAVEVPLATNSSSQFVQCRASGSNTALAYKMRDIADSCSLDAVEAGANQGIAMAQVLCRATCGYAATVKSIFSEIFKQSCKASFTDYVLDHCPGKANTLSFHLVRSQSCQL